MKKKTEERFNGQYYNQVNGTQYPAGFKKWLMEVAKVLQIEYDCFKGVIITSGNVHKYLGADGWLVYFMDGYNPRYAVVEDLKTNTR